MKKTTVFAFSLLIVLSMLLSACGGSATATEVPPAE